MIADGKGRSNVVSHITDKCVKIRCEDNLLLSFSFLVCFMYFNALKVAQGLDILIGWKGIGSSVFGMKRNCKSCKLNNGFSGLLTTLIFAAVLMNDLGHNGKKNGISPDAFYKFHTPFAYILSRMHDHPFSNNSNCLLFGVHPNTFISLYPLQNIMPI